MCVLSSSRCRNSASAGVSRSLVITPSPPRSLSDANIKRNVARQALCRLPLRALSSTVGGEACKDRRMMAAQADLDLIRKAEAVLAEIDRTAGLIDKHADVLAALRIRLEGGPRKSLEELLDAAGDIRGKGKKAGRARREAPRGGGAQAEGRPRRPPGEGAAQEEEDPRRPARRLSLEESRSERRIERVRPADLAVVVRGRLRRPVERLAVDRR